MAHVVTLYFRLQQPDWKEFYELTSQYSRTIRAISVISAVLQCIRARPKSLGQGAKWLYAHVNQSLLLHSNDTLPDEQQLSVRSLFCHSEAMLV